MTTHTRLPSTRPCHRFGWCTHSEPTHGEHTSAGVTAPEVEGMVLYVETDPDTGETTYGPVLTGQTERPATEARALAAQLRVAAARLDELATWAET